MSGWTDVDVAREESARAERAGEDGAWCDACELPVVECPCGGAA